MNILKAIFFRLLKINKKPSALEAFILNKIKENLEEKEACLWEKQINDINKVYRSPDKEEIIFYRMRNGHPYNDISISFINKSDEILIAKVLLTSVNNAALSLEASVWCVNGFVSIINYNHGNYVDYFEEYIGEVGLDELAVECEILANLSETVLN
ncbi:MAG TPA: hypothetical protein DEB31_10675 [Clostridiales bacterium]|nr:hypothetical protein [Clostridiales bacterium]